MRIVGIPVVDGDPLELRAQVPFHLSHQLTGKYPQFANVLRILGRDDEPKLVAIIPPALLELESVCFFVDRAVCLPRRSLAGDTLPLQVAQVGDGRSRPRPLQNHQPRLDDDTAGLPAQ